MSWVQVAVAGIGAINTARQASKQIRAQEQMTAAQLQHADRALDAQVKQADDLQAFNKQVYEEGRKRQVNLDAMTNRVVNMQMGIAQQQADRATESYNFYKTQGRPMVERAFQDANQYDSEENLAQARGRAAATVEQSFNNVQGRQQRALQRMGIFPNSGKFLALQQRLAADKALALTSAINGASESRRAGAIQLRQNAANLAQGFPAQANGQATSSTVAGNAAVNGNASMAGQNLALAGMALNGMHAGANIYGSAAGGYANLFGQTSARLNAIGAQAAADMQGWGQLAGHGLSQWGQGGASTGWGSFGGFDSTYTGAGSTGSGVGNAGAGDYAAWGQANGYANGGKIMGPGTGNLGRGR